MRKRFTLPALSCGALALIALAPAPVSTSAAQDTLRAVAVVNDEVISVLDLAMRTRLAILASGLTNSPDVRGRLQRQVLRSLIDEQLQLQEAKRLDISVSDSQLQGAVDLLAKQNKMSRQQFLDLLAQNKVLPSALFDQMRGDLTWQSVVRRRLEPSIEISDEEIDEVIGRLESSRGRMQLRVSEILFGVDDPLQEEDVRRAAERLVEQIRNGADFGALARQFSQSATATVGGDLGWIEEGQLPEELSKALARMRPGTLAGPIRTFGGYYILLMRDQRRISLGDATLDLKQILFAVPSGASVDEIQQAKAKADEARARIDGCDSIDALAREVGTQGSGDLGKLKLSQLPPALRQVLDPLPIGQVSRPVPVPGGISLLVVCGRELGGVDRGQIRQTLTAQRLDMLARRYLRDLRRAANVDIRL